MKTKELIDCLNDLIFDADYKTANKLEETIKRLEELDELKKCSVKGVDGEWVHIKDIQLLINIVKE